jgi:hypothetical protein
VLPQALSTVLEEEAGLFDFQLVQDRPDRLLLSTARAGQAGEHALQRARRLLAAFLARQGVAQVRIACRTAAPDVRGPSGKVQRVVARVQ